MSPGDTLTSSLTAIDDGLPVTLLGCTHEDVLQAVSSADGVLVASDGAVSLIDSLVGCPLIANMANSWDTSELFLGTLKSDPGFETALVEAGNFVGCQLSTLDTGSPLVLNVRNGRAPFYGHSGISYRVTFEYEELSLYFAPDYVVTGVLSRTSPTVTIPLTTTAPTAIPGSDGVANATLTIEVPATATYNYHTGSVVMTASSTKVGKNTWVLNQDQEQVITSALFQMVGDTGLFAWSARDPDPPFNPEICVASILVEFLAFVD